jgi:hypothetical protein
MNPYLQASNEWDGEFWPHVKTFGQRYPWTIAFMILLIAMCFGFWRVDQIGDDQAADRVARRAEVLKRDQQFCRAIPNTAVASAQALINIVVAQAMREGASKEAISNMKVKGLAYTEEARRLALAELPECPKILVTMPPTTP